MGDLNAKVGKEQNGEIHGKFKLGSSSGHEEKLI